MYSLFFGEKKEVRVRDLVARGYSIPGRTSQKGGWSGTDVSVSRVVGPSQGSGLMGLVGSRQGPIWSSMGPFFNCTPIQDSQVIHQGSSGPFGPYRVLTRFRRNPVLARQNPMGLDGSLDCPVLVCN